MLSSLLLLFAVWLNPPYYYPFLRLYFIYLYFNGFFYFENNLFSLLSVLPLAFLGDLEWIYFSLLFLIGFDYYTLRYPLSSVFFLKLTLTILSNWFSSVFFSFFPLLINRYSILPLLLLTSYWTFLRMLYKPLYTLKIFSGKLEHIWYLILHQ